MGFFHIITRFNANQLCHQAVHQISIIFCFVSICIGCQPQFYQLRISYIIQTEQVRTCFLNRGAIGFQSIRINSRKQLSGTMSQTFMQVRMEFACQIGIFIYQLQFSIAIHKFFIESVAMSSLIICIRNITDSHRFRTMMAAYPVGVRQIDTDSRCRIKVTGQNSSSNHLSRNTFHFIFFELFIYRRVIFKPLRIATDNLSTMRSFHILKVHQ